jgi:hypothetical protein
VHAVVGLGPIRVLKTYPHAKKFSTLRARFFFFLHLKDMSGVFCRVEIKNTLFLKRRENSQYALINPVN